ncbi:hypothetical protein BLOT_008743 [Blomia tropicalis]|nr:hypothetical protein BLOT_008743 [Blomia tropicalis]
MFKNLAIFQDNNDHVATFKIKGKIELLDIPQMKRILNSAIWILKMLSKEKNNQVKTLFCELFTTLIIKSGLNPSLNWSYYRCFSILIKKRLIKKLNNY